MKTTTRRFVYDGQEVLLDLNEDNEVLAKFTHSTLRTDDVLSADVTDLGEQKGYAVKGSYQYLKDHLGSIVDVADNSGNILQHFVYSSFGEIKKITDKNGAELSSPVVEHHFAFTGREFDEESNLYFYRARNYDPQIGRLLQTDPDPRKLKLPLSHLNKYAYSYNNSINFLDPSGEISISIGGILGGGMGWGWFANLGIAFVHDDSKSFSKGWEVGIEFGFGSGAYTGIGGDISAYLTVTSANSMSDLKGLNSQVGFSGGALGHVGIFAVGNVSDGKIKTGGTTFTLGFGVGAAGQAMVGNTWVAH